MVRANNAKLRSSKNHGLLRSRKRRGMLLIGALLTFLMVSGFKLHSTQVQLSETNQEIKVSDRKLAQAQQQHAQLKLGIKQLNDPDYLAQLIRDKYYYTKPGEKVYILPGDAAKDVTQN